jgi:ATP-dependent DNA ligase
VHARLHAKLLQPTCGAALRLKATSFLIDGEAWSTRDDGMSDFRSLRKADRARLAPTRPLTGVNLFREH